MNRTTTVKTLLLLLVMWMPLAMPCHASWDDDDDDYYNYCSDDFDDGWDDDFDDFDDDIDYENYLPEVVCTGTDRSGDDDDDGWPDTNDTDDDQNNIGEEDKGEDWTDGELDNSSVGAFHPNNNQSDVTPPLNLENATHVPVDGEVLFKKDLPAQSMKQSHNMDCVPTAMANLLSHLGCEQSAEEMRKNFVTAYTNDFRTDANYNGIYIENLNDFMMVMNFQQSTFAEIIGGLNSGSPYLGIIETDVGIHMVEIVGYYNDEWCINAFQCINPGTGEYETHYSSEFEKYKDYIYKKY